MLQDHRHRNVTGTKTSNFGNWLSTHPSAGSGSNSGLIDMEPTGLASYYIRGGKVTQGKRKGVKYIIKVL